MVWLRQNSRYRVPSPPGVCFMQIPASELLLFFSLTEGANSGLIWRSGQTRVLVTGWAWHLPFLSSLVRQPCCIVPEWPFVHVPSYGGIIWLKQNQFLIRN